MSDCKCEHNNHSHFFIWWAVWMLWMNVMLGMDCSGEHSKTERQINDLDNRVHTLEYRSR
jgi:hypothetical protein